MHVLPRMYKTIQSNEYVKNTVGCLEQSEETIMGLPLCFEKLAPHFIRIIITLLWLCLTLPSYVNNITFSTVIGLLFHSTEQCINYHKTDNATGAILPVPQLPLAITREQAMG